MKIKILIIIILAFTMVFLGVIMEIPSATPYSMYNTGDNGFSKIFERYSLKAISNITDGIISEANESIIIVPVILKPDEQTLQAFKKYLENGGKIIFLDEKGLINNFTRILINASVVVENTTIYDDIINYQGKRDYSLIITKINNQTLSCYAYRPAQIDIGTPGNEVNVIVLGTTSSYSLLDSNGNEHYDLGEQIGSQPVITRIDYGKGNVYLVSDIDMFSNKAIDLGDNSKLLNLMIGNRSNHYIFTHLVKNNVFDSIKEYFSDLEISGEEVSVKIVIELFVLLALVLVMYYGEETGIWR